MRFLIFGLFCVALTGFAGTTEFTYQGQLKQNGVPATGTFNIDFKLFDASTAGTQQGSTISKNGVAVSNGLFVVTLDFGQDVFSGTARYLEVSVTGASLPRQKLTPTPHAIVANKLAEQPKAYVKINAPVAIPINTQTVIPFDGEIFNTGNLYSSSTPTRLTASAGGVYLINASLVFASSPANPSARVLRIEKNRNGVSLVSDTRDLNKDCSATIIIKLDAGDYVELFASQNAETSLNLLNAYFSISLLP